MKANELFALLGVSDEVLVEVLREKQDEGAAEILYDRYREKLHWFVYHRVPVKEDAEGIVQEALIKALVEKLAQFEARGPGSFCRWLYTITYNLIRDYQRKFLKRLFVSLDMLLDQGRRFPAPEGPLIEKARVREHLEEAGLNPTECEIVELTYVYRMGPSDIETEIEIPSEEVSRILYRSKQKLKRKLSPKRER